MPNIADLAYMAGLVDGEGSVHIVMQDRKKLYVRPRIAIGMVELECVRWAFRTFPGGRLYIDLPVNAPNGRKQNRVDWTGNQVVPLLQQIYPYLKLKAPQAEIIFKLEELRKKREWGFAVGKKRGTLQGRSPQLVDELIDCYLQCKRLNRRGLHMVA